MGHSQQQQLRLLGPGPIGSSSAGTAGRRPSLRIQREYTLMDHGGGWLIDILERGLLGPVLTAVLQSCGSRTCGLCGVSP
jgi:hypothetical protein